MLTHDLHHLHVLLDSVPDTFEIVVRRSDADDVATAAWEAARDDACDAWSDWSSRPDSDRWTVYVATRDREDAALAVLRASAPAVG